MQIFSHKCASGWKFTFCRLPQTSILKSQLSVSNSFQGSFLAPLAGMIKRILCSDWLPGQTRGLSCPLGIARFVPIKATFFGVIFWPHNKSFLDQACSVKMAGSVLALFFLCVFVNLDFAWSIITQEKELGQYPTILAEQLSLINNAYLLAAILSRKQLVSDTSIKTTPSKELI